MMLFYLFQGLPRLGDKEALDNCCGCIRAPLLKCGRSTCPQLTMQQDRGFVALSYDHSHHQTRSEIFSFVLFGVA